MAELLTGTAAGYVPRMVVGQDQDLDGIRKSRGGVRWGMDGWTDCMLSARVE
jgi:hypothetical protein